MVQRPSPRSNSAARWPFFSFDCSRRGEPHNLDRCFSTRLGASDSALRLSSRRDRDATCMAAPTEEGTPELCSLNDPSLNSHVLRAIGLTLPSPGEE